MRGYVPPAPPLVLLLQRSSQVAKRLLLLRHRQSPHSRCFEHLGPWQPSRHTSSSNTSGPVRAMSVKAPTSDLPSHAFETPTAFEAFLEREHQTAPGIYLKLAKKASGIPSINAAEAVEVALCFGWIDGQARGLDENWFCVRYTPRRPKSLWSQKNVNTIGRLQEAGRLRPAGLAAVQAAKDDGRWDRAYAGSASMTVPNDLALALSNEPVAAALFAGMNKTDRYPVLWRVQTAAPKNRSKRIQDLVALLKEHKKPGSQPKKVEHPASTMRARKARVRKVVKEQDIDLPLAEVSTVSSLSETQPRRQGLRPRR